MTIEAITTGFTISIILVGPQFAEWVELYWRKKKNHEKAHTAVGC